MTISSCTGAVIRSVPRAICVCSSICALSGIAALHPTNESADMDATVQQQPVLTAARLGIVRIARPLRHQPLEPWQIDEPACQWRRVEAFELVRHILSPGAEPAEPRGALVTLATLFKDFPGQAIGQHRARE